MKKLAIGLAVSVVAFGAASVAQAADPIMVDDAAIAMATSGWDGAYGGLGVIFETAATGPAETLIGLQAIVGANATMSSFLVGGELYLQPAWSSIGGFGAGVGGEVRAGFLPSEAVLIYGALGLEYDFSGGTFTSVGGGVEFMAMEDMSIDIEYKYYMAMGGPARYHHVGISANWHF